MLRAFLLSTVMAAAMTASAHASSWTCKFDPDTCPDFGGPEGAAAPNGGSNGPGDSNGGGDGDGSDGGDGDGDDGGDDGSGDGDGDGDGDGGDDGEGDGGGHGHGGGKGNHSGGGDGTNPRQWRRGRPWEEVAPGRVPGGGNPAPSRSLRGQKDDATNDPASRSA